MPRTARSPPRLLLLLPLLLLQPLSARASCVLDGAACVCTDADGEAWDVSELQGLDITTTGDITGCALCEGEWTYHFALCGNANQQIGNGCLSTQFRSAYRVDGSTPTARCEYLGADQAAAPAAEVTAIDGGIAIGYNGGQTGTLLRTMTVNLLCDTPYLDAPSPGVPGGDNPVLNWPTQAVCPAGGNTGWLIVILFSVAAGIYVGGGIGYVKRQDPDVPLMEAHPHTEMWRTVPGLFWDGVYFTRVELSSRFEFLGFLAPAVRALLPPPLIDHDHHAVLGT